MEEQKTNLSLLQTKLKALIKQLGIETKQTQLLTLEAQATKPSFWKDETNAKNVSRQIADIKNDLTSVQELSQKITETQDLLALASQEEDTSLKKDITTDIKRITKKLKALEIKTFLSGPHDQDQAIISLHSGQGGTEAMDWTAMLLRMYLKFFEKKNWDFSLVNETPGEEAGLKSATVLVNNSFAYGYLKGEAGTHRLVRQSPFNADNLRQTSFALVEVMPQVDETPEITIKDEDIQFNAFRSSGKGGQNVNKVSTAVRLKHIPTGIVVECQTERRQEQNRKIALKLLTAKLWQLQELKRQQEAKDLKGEHKIAGWGHQIRSYVLHPYKLVKDLRTNIETSEPEKVLDGHLSKFIEAELRLLNN